MNDKVIGVGVIGCGEIAQLMHLPYLDELPSLRIAALCDISAGVLQKLGTQYGVEALYADYRALLADPAVDAVVICTYDHGEIVQAALAAGKHVLVEKPLAFTPEEARPLVEQAEASGLVAMVGFGPFAGFLTLSFATIGFLSKLLAEDIEDIDPAPVEAIRAAGAGWASLLAYSVLPQVAPRLIGLSLYRLDINFRESAVVGIVGAGGIGATLNTAIDRYEFDSAAAVLILIIAIVMASEYTSSVVRKWVR